MLCSSTFIIFNIYMQCYYFCVLHQFIPILIMGLISIRKMLCISLLMKFQFCIHIHMIACFHFKSCSYLFLANYETILHVLCFPSIKVMQCHSWCQSLWFIKTQLKSRALFSSSKFDEVCGNFEKKYKYLLKWISSLLLRSLNN